MIGNNTATAMPKDCRISEVQEKVHDVDTKVSRIEHRVNKIHRILFGPEPTGTDKDKKPQVSGVLGEIWETGAKTSKILEVIELRLDRICGALNCDDEADFPDSGGAS